MKTLYIFFTAIFFYDSLYIYAQPLDPSIEWQNTIGGSKSDKL